MGYRNGLGMKFQKQKAFTLIELLVVIAIVALLLSVVVPSLLSAKTQARKIICRAHLHQLLLANLSYASENGEHFVPAASDMNDPDLARRNLTRWQGKRDTVNDPFDPSRGPLASYLQTGKVKECPQKVYFVKGQTWNANYEDGAGGYGYNNTYLGSRHWDKNSSYPQNDRDTTKVTEVGSPAATLMFADCAITKDDSDGVPYYMETSFAWQVHIMYSGRVMDGTDGMPELFQSPTIHFRHDKWANVAWVDGHIDQMEMALFEEINVFGVTSSHMQIGWFEPLDNSLYDLK
jgi:prepilin-type N-terminal cleavage/methylation domain-containing protein/prepilin-type processing-associated H-X9-DG protein